MKYLINILFFLFIGTNMSSQQNLVPNGSFEEYYFCPYDLSQLDTACKYWFTPWSISDSIQKGSSDYFNTCGTGAANVPNNFIELKYPKSGNSYAGFAFKGLGWNEYIEIEINNLTKNNKYCLEFYYAISSLVIGYNDNQYKLGSILSDSIVNRQFSSSNINPKPIVTNNAMEIEFPDQLDTVNWLQYSFSFVSKGNEKYLTIGNFSNDDTNKTIYIYLYIDDVKLYYCGPDTTQTTKEIEIPNIFTPNGDGYNDVFEYKNQENWHIETQIFNRWGELLFSESNVNWDGKYKGKKVSEGVYFYKINAKAVRGGEIRVYNGVVHVIYN